jgi:hypothetical protein
VTGSIQRPDGTPVNGTIEFVLSQQAKTTTPPILFAPVRTTCSVTDGEIVAGCTVQGNDTLDPAGTYYTVRVLDQNNRVIVPAANYTLAGASVDLGMLPVTATATLVPPTGNVVGNLNVTGNLTVGGSAGISGAELTTSHLQLLGLPADPSTATEGSVFHRSDLNRIRIRALGLQLFDGTGFIDINSSQPNTVDISANLKVGGSTQLGSSADLSCSSAPPATPSSGNNRIYCLTGDKRLYQKNDSGVESGPLAALNQPQTWTAAQTFGEANNVVYADGQAGADASAKISACIAALPSTGGTCDARGLEGAQTLSSDFLSGVTKPARILFGDATFAVSAGVTLTVGNNHTLIGAGQGRTVFRFANAGAAHGFAVSCDNCTLQGITADLQNTGTGSAFRFTQFQRSALYDVEAKQAGGHGFFFDGQGNGQTVHRSVARRIVTTSNAGHGWYVKNSQAGFGNGPFTIEDLNALSNGGDGIRDESLDGVTRNSKNVYINARTISNGGDGVELVGSGDLTFIGLESELNTGWGVRTTAVSGSKVDGVNIWMLGLTSNAGGEVDDSGAEDFYLQKSFGPPEWDQLVLGRPAHATNLTRLVIREGTGQTADVLQFQAADTTVRGRFTKEGFWQGGDVAPTAMAGAAGSASFNLRKIASQTGDFLQLRDEFGSLLTTKLDVNERLTIPSVETMTRFDLPASTTPPGTCTANRSLFVDADATPAGQQLYLCNSAGTGWNLVGDGGGAGGGYATIEDEGAPLTQRTTLNFSGAGVSCADDSTKTTCTIPGGGTAAWEALINSADSATAYNSNNTAETFTETFSAAFSTGTQHKIAGTGAFTGGVLFGVAQETGNPTDGTLGQFLGADASVNLLRVKNSAAADTSHWDLYSGEDSGGFSATTVNNYLAWGYNAFATLNKGTTARNAALTIVNEDNTANNHQALLLAALANHTTGTKGWVPAIQADAYSLGAGDVTSLLGLTTYVEQAGSGTVAGAFGLYVGSNVDSGAGSITDNYGILVDAQTAGSANNWAIRTLGAARSQFGGPVDTDVGYRIGNGAASGNYLRGDGTNFVSSTIQEGDIPASLTRDTEWPSASATLTNKTLDAEATGNSVTTVSKITLVAAGCNNATAGPGFDLPTSNAPTPACLGTSPHRFGSLDFSDGSTQTAVTHFRLPGDWTGGVDAAFLYTGDTSSTNNIRWQVSSACVADSEDLLNPTYNSASASNVAGPSTAGQRRSASFSSVSMSNCAAGETVFWKFERVGGDAGDTYTGLGRLLEVEITLRRAQ